MNLAILGAGMIVQDFLSMSSSLPEIKLKTIFGLKNDLTHLKKLQNQYQIEQVSIAYDECLKNDEIDTVYVGLPNSLHYQYAKAALLAGKNVICEKPFTIKLWETEELKKIALKHNLVLLEAITNQYSETYLSLKKELVNIGTVRLVECNTSHYSSRYYQFLTGKILPAFDPQMGGGALLDLNIYNIHFIMGIFGMPNKVNYIANVQKGIDVSGILILEYSDFKAVCLAGKDSSCYTPSAVQGENGTIIIPDGINLVDRFIVQKSRDERQEISQVDGQHRMFSEFQKFVEVIRTHDMVFVENMLNHSVNVMKIVDLALKDANLTIG